MLAEELNEKLDLLYIRLNTSPKTYQKEDFILLCECLDELCDMHEAAAIELVDSWQEVVEKETIPGGELIKSTIELIQLRLENLNSSKLDVLTAGEGIDITDNVITNTRTSVEIPIIDKTQDPASSFSIDPNKMYMFGTRTSLTISFLAGLPGIVSEYMFQFTSGSTATTLVVPNTVVWLKDPDIQANKTYQVSIVNDLAIIGEWNNE